MVCLDRIYFAKTENWKYCSKIIFKCVNSIVGSIFNENFAKKCNLWDPWTVHGCTVHYWLSQKVRLKQKKRKLKTRENIKRNRGHRSKPHLSVIQEKEKKKIIKKKFQTG